jgi:hypothetical protein
LGCVIVNQHHPWIKTWLDANIWPRCSIQAAWTLVKSDAPSLPSFLHPNLEFSSLLLLA